MNGSRVIILIARKEHFGYTLFDKEKLNHRFSREMPEGSILLPERLFPRTDILSAPIRVYWEVTNICNLRCKHCHNSSGKSLDDELSTDEAIKTVREMARDNIFDLRISGGEPIQHPDWFEIFSEARDSGMALSFNTNGFYGSQHNKTIERFLELNPEQITFSLDGNRKHHDNLRCPGSFDAVLKSMADLHLAGYRHLRINSVMIKGYEDSLFEVMDLAGKYCDEMNCFYMRISGRARNLEKQAMNMEELKEIDRTVETLMSSYPQVNFIFNEGSYRKNSIEEEDFTGLEKGLQDGITRFNLFANGAVQPGGYTPRLTNTYYL